MECVESLRHDIPRLCPSWMALIGIWAPVWGQALRVRPHDLSMDSFDISSSVIEVLVPCPNSGVDDVNWHTPRMNDEQMGRINYLQKFARLEQNCFTFGLSFSETNSSCTSSLSLIFRNRRAHGSWELSLNRVSNATFEVRGSE